MIFSKRDAIARQLDVHHGSAFCKLVEAVEAAVVADQVTPLRDLLERARDAITALDGTSVEKEKLVDDYHRVMGD
jgi:hypothetical protein